jgi:5'-nucleotidase / UDP-sugar diphosphatase
MAEKQPGVPPNMHTIQNGDTLFDLAQAYYNDGSKWTEIQKANNNVDPEELKVG